MANIQSVALSLGEEKKKEQRRRRRRTNDRMKI